MHMQEAWRDADPAHQAAQPSSAVISHPNTQKAAQLHMANVRLYASKMRTDAKMHSLAADLEMFKQEAAPELEVAQKVARKAQPKKIQQKKVQTTG